MGCMLSYHSDCGQREIKLRTVLLMILNSVVEKKPYSVSGIAARGTIVSLTVGLFTDNSVCGL